MQKRPALSADFLGADRDLPIPRDPENVKHYLVGGLKHMNKTYFGSFGAWQFFVGPYTRYPDQNAGTNRKRNNIGRSSEFQANVGG